MRVVEYDNGEQLLWNIADPKNNYDLILLEINTGKINGMETARRLRGLGVKTPLVFIAGTRKYAVESYEVEASGYLLKPVEPKKVMYLM